MSKVNITRSMRKWKEEKKEEDEEEGKETYSCRRTCS